MQPCVLYPSGSIKIKTWSRTDTRNTGTPEPESIVRSLTDGHRRSVTLAGGSHAPKHAVAETLSV